MKLSIALLVLLSSVVVHATPAPQSAYAKDEVRDSLTQAGATAVVGCEECVKDQLTRRRTQASDPVKVACADTGTCGGAAGQGAVDSGASGAVKEKKQ